MPMLTVVLKPARSLAKRRSLREGFAATQACLGTVRSMVDGHALVGVDDDDQRIDWFRLTPFIIIHLALFSIVWTGIGGLALALAAVLYVVRMFAITAFYHRQLAHRSFACPRWLRFFGCLAANSSAQRGPLWWAAHHRAHHRHSDTPDDRHTPQHHGFLVSHVLWFCTRGAFRTRRELVPDLWAQWELRFLDRFDWLAPLLLAALCYLFGEWAGSAGWETSGAQMLVVGFGLSTVACFHATFTINSLAHRWGSRRYPTRDDSRNNWLLALLTFGEGWHNNHHFYPASVRQGFRWYEIDATWYALRALAVMGLIRDMRGIPQRILDQPSRVERAA